MSKILLFLGLVLSSSGHLYAQSIKADHARIKILTKASSKIPKTKKKRAAYLKEYQTACKMMGDAMLAGKGPWGFGILSSYSCYWGSQKISGEATKAAWEVQIVDSRKNSRFSIYKIFGKRRLMSRVTLDASDATMKFLNDREFSDLLVYTLLDAMPMAMAVTPAMFGTSDSVITGRHPYSGESYRFKYETPEPPASLALYSVKYNNTQRLFEAKFLGTGKLENVEKPKVEGSKDAKKLVGGSVTYTLPKGVKEQLGGVELWAHSSAGPGQQSKVLKENLKEAHLALNAAAKGGKLDSFMKGKFDDLAGMLLETIAGGYVGLRYGLQVHPGDSIQTDTSVFSLLVEIRGGPVEGLRYYYDTVPQITRNEEVLDPLTNLKSEEETSITWSRHVLGFSLGFDVDSVVDKITFDPKLGIWTYNAQLVSKYDADGETPIKVSDFSVGTTASVALEVGVEWLSDWYTIRGWYAIDSGVSIVKTGGTITSNRFGIDTFTKVGPQFAIFGLPVKTALMGFYFFESVSIESGSVDPNADLGVGEVEITGIEYDSGYAGAGVLISW